MTQIRSLADEPQKGNVLLYKLRLEDRPTQPNEIHHGIIKRIFIEIGDKHQHKWYLVQSIEHPDYEELVYPHQVTGYQPYIDPYSLDKRW